MSVKNQWQLTSSAANTYPERPHMGTLLPVLICHRLHCLSEEVSLFLQLTADQSSFAVMLPLTCELRNEEPLNCTVM